MRHWGLALVLAAFWTSGCGNPESSSPQSLEEARAGGASLITGNARDWRAASEEERGLYSMASVDALLAQTGATASSETRLQLASAFKMCMNTIVERSSPSARLSDVSLQCRDMALSGLR